MSRKELLPIVDNPAKDEGFDMYRQMMSQLEPSDFTDAGALVIAESCEGCPVATTVSGMHSSGDERWFDPNERSCHSMMLMEFSYRNCLGRPENQIPRWKAIIRRVLATEDPRTVELRKKSKNQEAGSFHACGLDIEVTAEPVEQRHIISEDSVERPSN